MKLELDLPDSENGGMWQLVMRDYSTEGTAVEIWDPAGELRARTELIEIEAESIKSIVHGPY